MAKFIEMCLEEPALFISSVSTLIAAASAIVAHIGNRQNRKQYLESIQPQLSMSLVEIDDELFLRIKNTGQTAAKAISITVHRINNNGANDTLYLDDLFKSEFELYPEESVQGLIGIAGRNIATSIFPSADISVSYRCGNKKKKCQYDRSVTYFNGHADKIAVDVNMNTSNIETSLSSTNRAVVRMANYLDGRQVAAFDELNILAGHSLKSDLQEVLGQMPAPVLTRRAPKHEALTGQKNSDTEEGDGNA